jgi:REP element-mobilizing transposase RayT
MPQSLSRILIHIIFSTKHRQPLIDDAIEAELHTYLGGACKELNCYPIIVGGHHDHVHILCDLSRTIAVMKLLEKVKANSSKWIKTMGEPYEGFYWQDGYAAFSVSPANIDSVCKYIANQKEHHSTISFQDECRAYFKKYKMDYDERYVWD